MAKMLRVQYLLDRVTSEGRPAVARRSYPDASDYRLVTAHQAMDEAPALVSNGTNVGVLQSIDRPPLVDLATQRDARIEMLVEVGEYVAVGDADRPHPRPRPEHRVTGDEVAACFLIGGERTLIQDPGFVFRQLVDIAIRALSPAVNDPTTGVQAIDRMVDLLATVAARPDPTGWFADEGRHARGCTAVSPASAGSWTSLRRSHPLRRRQPPGRAPAARPRSTSSAGSSATMSTPYRSASPRARSDPARAHARGVRRHQHPARSTRTRLTLTSRVAVADPLGHTLDLTVG